MADQHLLDEGGAGPAGAEDDREHGCLSPPAPAAVPLAEQARPGAARRALVGADDPLHHLDRVDRVQPDRRLRRQHEAVGPVEQRVHDVVDLGDRRPSARDHRLEEVGGDVDRCPGPPGAGQRLRVGRTGTCSIGTSRERSPRSMRTASARPDDAVHVAHTGPALDLRDQHVVRDPAGSRVCTTSSQRFANDSATWRMPAWRPRAMAARSLSLSAGRCRGAGVITTRLVRTDPAAAHDPAEHAVVDTGR